MRRFLNFLVGFFLTISLLSLFSTWALSALLCLLGGIVYLLFFPSSRRVDPASVLLGSLVALIILTPGRIGQEGLLGLLIYSLILLLRDTVRFTSEYNRFIVALIVTLGSYPLIMLPWRLYFAYTPQVLLSLLLLLTFTFTLQQSRRPPDYELV